MARIFTVVYRAYMINSSYESLHTEIEELRKIFRRNAYPSSFFDKCVLRFFDKIHGNKLPVLWPDVDL